MLIVNKMGQLKERMREYHGLTTHRIFEELENRFPENGNSVYMRDLKDASMQYFGTGKGFRPAFLFLFNKLFSDVKDEAVNLAASIEVLHTSSLVHDDWMDQDEERRGVPAVWKEFSDILAILSGDYLIGLSYYLAGERASELGEVFMDLCRGQQMDIDFETRDFMEVPTSASLDMLHLKTSVLFETACKWGASIGGADDHQKELVGEYARLVGIAFQLQDDLLNIFGDPEITGKPIGSDLLNGKKNPLVLTTLENASIADREYLLKYLGTKMDEFALQSCIQIVERYGCGNIEYMRDNYIKGAVNILMRLPDNETRGLLESFAQYCGSREK